MHCASEALCPSCAQAGGQGQQGPLRGHPEVPPPAPDLLVVPGRAVPGPVAQLLAEARVAVGDQGQPGLLLPLSRRRCGRGRVGQGTRASSGARRPRRWRPAWAAPQTSRIDLGCRPCSTRPGRPPPCGARGRRSPPRSPGAVSCLAWRPNVVQQAQSGLRRARPRRPARRPPPRTPRSCRTPPPRPRAREVAVPREGRGGRGPRRRGQGRPPGALAVRPARLALVLPFVLAFAAGPGRAGQGGRGGTSQKRSSAPTSCPVFRATYSGE